MLASCLLICLAASMQTAATVHIVRDVQDEVTVETTTGSLRLPAGSSTPIKLDTSPDSVVRFSIEGRPALKVPSADLLTSGVWHVEQIQRSGSLFLWATAGHITRPPAGAAIITAETAACATAETFRLGLLMSASIPNPMFFLTTTEVGGCRWVVIGLPTGTYRAALSNARGSSGSREFRFIAPETADVTIPAPLVTISGIVTLNGKPVTDGRIQFRLNFGITNFDLEADGSYHAAFDVEGQYTLSLLRPLGRVKPIALTLVPGPNVFDWHIEDPSADSELIVRVTGQDRLVETAIEIQANGIVLMRPTIPAGEDVLTRTGLAFGKYTVFARQPDASSDAVDVDLSDSARSVSIVLSLKRATRSITLRDTDGEPVSHAGFGNMRDSPEETPPGTYTLASFAANSEVYVRPPTGAPLCRVVPREGEIQATVFPGRSLTLKFQNRRVSVEDIKIQSDGCPVPIQLFLKSPVRMGAQTADLEVLNAPPHEWLVIHTRDGVYHAAVPPDGVVFVPAKQ